MAKVLQQGAHTANGSVHFIPSVHALTILRLITGIVMTLGATISLIGTSWDIQWHSFVGRDRTLIPPHEMMLAGIAISGLMALIEVLLETSWVRRNLQLSQYSTNFAGLFNSSLGTYLAGFAALNAAIAFPLDSYWHALYGIDVAIWAPFHIMIITGMAIIALGAAYVLASSTQLARQIANDRIAASSKLLTLVALGTMMGLFTLMLSDALDNQNYLNTGLFAVNIFPFIAGLVATFAYTTAQQATGTRWAATTVMGIYVLFALIFSVFVPPATNALVASEHLSYRTSLHAYAFLSVTAVRLWPLLPILVAPLMDLVHQRAKQQRWSEQQSVLYCAFIGLIACFPAAILYTGVAITMIKKTGFIGFPITIALGFAGTYLGSRFGHRSGKVMSQAEGSIA